MTPKNTSSFKFYTLKIVLSPLSALMQSPLPGSRSLGSEAKARLLSIKDTVTMLQSLSFGKPKLSDLSVLSNMDT